MSNIKRSLGLELTRGGIIAGIENRIYRVFNDSYKHYVSGKFNRALKDLIKTEAHRDTNLMRSARRLVFYQGSAGHQENVHAEVKIVDFLFLKGKLSWNSTTNRIDVSDISTPINIGITKHCCLDCMKRILAVNQLAGPQTLIEVAQPPASTEARPSIHDPVSVLDSTVNPVSEIDAHQLNHIRVRGAIGLQFGGPKNPYKEPAFIINHPQIRDVASNIEVSRSGGRVELIGPVKVSRGQFPIDSSSEDGRRDDDVMRALVNKLKLRYNSSRTRGR